MTFGGWDGSVYASDLISSAAARTSFAATLVETMGNYSFDGIDIDFEYPGQQGIGCNSVRPEDAANLLRFLEELRKRIGNGKLVTAVAADSTFIGSDGNPLADVSEYAKYLDYINLMVYDEAGEWDPNSASASPLGQPESSCGSDASVYSGVAAWTNAGFPAAKILLGIPTYAHGLTTLNATLEETTVDGYKTLINQPISDVLPKGTALDVTGGVDVCGNPTGYTGEYLYTELIEQGLLSTNGSAGVNGYTRYWDECSQTAFLFNPDERHFVTYEDTQSAVLKAKWAKSKGIAGVMTFDSVGWPESVFEAVGSALSAATERHPRRLD